MSAGRLFSRLLLGCTTLAMPTWAVAQTASSTPAGAVLPAGNPAGTAHHGVEEVVVTAQKRRESAQKVPIAMRVISGATLTQAGITDINGLQRLAPDLGITQNTIYTQLALRGVTAETIAEGADTALTINEDGEYINRPVALNATFYDLDRIEILKGPQGTLYGRNSTAGAISIIDAKPVLGRYSGSLSAGVGNYGAFNTQAMINVPVADGLAIRGAMLHSQNDGYSNNDVGNGTAGRGSSSDATSGRISAAYVKDHWDLYVAGEYVGVDQSPPAEFGVTLSPTDPGVVNGVPYGTTFNLPRQNFPLQGRGFFRSNQYSIRGHVTYHVNSEIDLTYTGGYLDNHTSSVIPLNGFVPALFSNSSPHLDSTDLSNELRASYRGPGGLFVQGGFFYFRETQDVQTGLFLPQVNNAFVNYFIFPNILVNSYAGFAQADIPITSTLKVTGGVRYSQDDKSALYHAFAGFSFTRPQVGDPGFTTIPQSYSRAKTTYLGSIEWTPAPDHLLYAKVATGYRSGGFDPLTKQTVNGTTVGNFAPETLTDYEIGSKNRFLDGRVEYNLNAFHYDYKDEQVSIFINDAIGQATINAAASRFWGVENDLTVAATDDDRITLSVNYLDAAFTAFPTFVTSLTGAQVPIDLKGKAPPQAPRFAISAGYNHTFDLGPNGTVTAGVYTKYKSHYFLTAFNFAGDRQDGYTQTDVTLGYTTANGRYSVQAYGRNLENNIPIAYAAYVGGGINIYNYIFGTPRTYGLQATAHF